MRLRRWEEGTQRAFRRSGRGGGGGGGGGGGRLEARSSSAILRAFSWRAGPGRLGRPIETLRAREEKESREQETEEEEEEEDSDERRPHSDDDLDEEDDDRISVFTSPFPLRPSRACLSFSSRVCAPRCLPPGADSPGSGPGDGSKRLLAVVSG